MARCESQDLLGHQCQGDPHGKPYELHIFEEMIEGQNFAYLWNDHESKQARDLRVAKWAEVCGLAYSEENPVVEKHLLDYADILKAKIDG